MSSAGCTIDHCLPQVHIGPFTYLGRYRYRQSITYMILVKGGTLSSK